MIRVNNQSILVFAINIALLLPISVNAQHFKGPIDTNHQNLYSYQDHLDLGGGMEKYSLPIQLGTFLYLEYGIDHHSSKKPRSKPNSLDGYFRDKDMSKQNLETIMTGDPFEAEDRFYSLKK